LSTKPKLIVITGPTASGKTALSIWLAQQLHCDILSADARQFYRELKIGSAAPTEVELAAANHHFIGNKSITAHYNAGLFAQDALVCLENLFQKIKVQILCGGSGMYIKALTEGLDDLPDADPEIREKYKRLLASEGIAALQRILEKNDPEYFNTVDQNNPQRIIRALEIIEQTGQSFTSLRLSKKQNRSFDIIYIALDLPRALLYDRINERTIQMIDAGWLEECAGLKAFKNHNALQTVGYKEIFEYFEGSYDLNTCIALIQQNTRRFAKRQLTYIRNQFNPEWINPENKKNLMDFITRKLNEQ
jgi:tRNA dimethylallyltransferase